MHVWTLVLLAVFSLIGMPAQAAEKCVALTFDDGPDKTLTPQLLDILADEGVHATFFVVGRRVATWPSIVARAHQEGHEIGNHTWDHPKLTELSNAQVRRQLSRTDAAIEAAIGERPRVLRAPYGDLDARVASLDRRPFVGWYLDTLDWKKPKPDTLVTKVSTGVRENTIVLLHDIQPTTIEAVPGIISDLKYQGYRFVTVSELPSCR